MACNHKYIVNQRVQYIWLTRNDDQFPYSNLNTSQSILCGLWIANNLVNNSENEATMNDRKEPIYVRIRQMMVTFINEPKW